MLAPVLTIDGPTASGKGTLSRQLARTLNFHYLDSGALYRVFALHLEGQGFKPGSTMPDVALEQLARELPVVFDDDRIVPRHPDQVGQTCLGGALDLPTEDAVGQSGNGFGDE